jgi:hypothetical protein
VAHHDGGPGDAPKTGDCANDAGSEEAPKDAAESAAGEGGRDASKDTGPADASKDTGPADAYKDTGPADVGVSDVAMDVAVGEAGCTGSTPVALTVLNVLVWCSVSVEGGASSAAAQQTVCVAPGVVSLAATSLPGFELGPAPWHDTSGDLGSGDPGTLVGDVDSTTVSVTSGSACVWVCCPFTDGTGCPITDQCP